MKRKYTTYLPVFIFLFMLFSCTKEESGLPEQENYLQLKETVSTNSKYDIQFLSKDSLFVGYNKVFFKLTDKNSGLAVKQASLVLHPLMDMGTFKHACPFENPDVNASSSGYFEGAVLFSMPGSDNSWSLAVSIDVNGIKDSVNFLIQKVTATDPVKKIVVIDSVSNGQGGWIITKYPISLVESSPWKVGSNPFEITIHTMASMMSFPCCDDFTIEVTPEMPSMGHGSPNNVNPVLISKGHYKGVVNFTMTGAWRIHILLKKDGREIGKNVFFDITL